MSEEEYSEEEYEEEEEEEVAATPAAAPAEPEAAADEPEETEEAEPAAPAPPAPADDEPKKEEAPQLRKVERKQEEAQPESLTEAEQAMLAAKKRHEEEEAAKLLDYEERRKLEREQTERELEELRQRQAERRAEWAKEEAEFAARRRQDDERRRQEEEARKAKSEADRQRREEERQRRGNMMAGALLAAASGEKPGRNFVVVKKERSATETSDTRPRKPGGKTAEQIAEAKQQYLSVVARPVDVSNLLPNDLKNKIKQLHAKIVRLESEKYDLEKRKDRQEYDLKELSEREKQASRKKAISRGLDPDQIADASNSVIPPKIIVASKFDRQTDRSSYSDRRERYEKPVVKPPPSIAHGTAKPPPEWGRKTNDELEALRKNLEPFKYIEHEKVEGARPPVQPIPLQLPTDDFETSAPAEPEPVAEEPPKPAPKGRAGKV
ncbi:unnamed protein product [Bursaphelenchus xylophilus]|uniref:(pine wood nematode) hypothetical protein n=1 Tax=Bursaphelenchus xylophilus TaxID=6326 RepID=A0A1I7SR55_BURXY|nr:unnamed protein product [Bursaphelenchus xylophilus]CAG9110853.1 unnamed protein product [Bursaphelenchus xylophilus]